MASLIQFKLNAEAHAKAETARRGKLSAWVSAVLERLGLPAKIAQAQSVADLGKIILDVDKDVEIAIAIREALHPAAGQKADHFIGLTKGALKRLLKIGFDDLKKKRAAELLHSGAASGKRGSPDWTNDLKFDDKGGVRPILTNLILFLRNYPVWKDVIAFNEFTALVVIRGDPYWGDVEPDRLWADHHDTFVRTWFQDEDIAAAQGDVGRAVQATARANRFNPVRDYLDGREWDGKPRIDNWLSVYFHADNNPYTRAVGPRWLIGAVARIYEPGCQVDHTLVLEGPQGRLKSKGLRVLAVQDEWFTDRLSHMSSKDASQETAGVWIIELGELDALLRANSSSSKSFLTQRFERYRPSYGKHTIRRGRQCVFAGSINPPVGGYLKDPTGSRRIWPVLCHGMIDLEALARDRDQLWAEAIVRYRAGEKWYLETPELEALAAAEQRARFKVDAWQEPIEKWLGKRKDTSVTEILQHVFGLAPREQNRSAQMRVAEILTRLGFSKHRPRSKGGKRTKSARENRYWR